MSKIKIEIKSTISHNDLRVRSAPWRPIRTVPAERKDNPTKIRVKVLTVAAEAHQNLLLKNNTG